VAHSYINYLPRRPAADQVEFLAAVKEVAASLQPVFERRPELLRAFQAMCEPERQASGMSLRIGSCMMQQCINE